MLLPIYYSMIRSFLLIVLSTVVCRGAVYDPFPGFKVLYERADFVGVVELVKRDFPKDEETVQSDLIGPHRFFEIKSVKIFKGREIRSEVARLADRRLQRDGTEEILVPTKRFLVFMIGAPEDPSRLAGWKMLHGDRYRWDELHAEGAVLSVPPNVDLERVDVVNPFDFFEQVIRNAGGTQPTGR
jgi:hypothetical protein